MAYAAALSTPPTRPPKKFYGGAGVGRLTLDSDYDKWQCKYDMVLVERIQGKAKTQSGLFVPEEDLPKLHVCRGTYIDTHKLSSLTFR